MKLINFDFSDEKDLVTIELSSEEMTFIGTAVLDKVLACKIGDEHESEMARKIISACNKVLLRRMFQLSKEDE